MLNKILRPKREEVTRDLRQLHNEWLHDLYCSKHYLGHQMKNYEMDRTCGMQAGEMYSGFLQGNLKERGHLEDLSIDQVIIIILKWLLKKWYGRAWPGSVWLRIGTSGRLL
jgi:hypothetical protein